MIIIQPVISKVRHFSTFFAHFGLSYGYALGTIAVNVTWMEREFNAGQTHSSLNTLFPFINAVVDESLRVCST